MPETKIRNHSEYAFTIRVYYKDTGRFRSIASGDDLDTLKEGILENYDPDKSIFVVQDRFLTEEGSKNGYREWVPDQDMVHAFGWKDGRREVIKK